MSEPFEQKSIRRRRPRPSLFGPIVLIAIGMLFLLSNMGVISDLGWNWIALLRLWPLWLVFLGLNIIVRQAPGALGTLLSAIVGLLAVAVVAYVLFFSETSVLLDRLNVSTTAELQTETVELSAAGVDSAGVDIDFGAPGASIGALDDSSNLIEGTISYAGELVFDTDVSDGRAEVRLVTRSNGNDGWSFLNPNNWFLFDDEHSWQISLNPGIPTDLTLDVGSGEVVLDLTGLDVSELRMDGGSGRLEVSLPGGNYDVTYDAGSGSTRMVLPDGGRLTVDIEAGSGGMTLLIPRGIEARVEIDGGSGGFDIDRNRFTQVSGSDAKEGIWETSDYDDAPDRVNLIIDGGSGGIRIAEP